MKNFIAKIIRTLIATTVIIIGAYWLSESLPEWKKASYSILSTTEREKEAFFGVFFSVIFLAYGLWEITNIVKNKKT